MAFKLPAGTYGLILAILWPYRWKPDEFPVPNNMTTKRLKSRLLATVRARPICSGTLWRMVFLHLFSIWSLSLPGICSAESADAELLKLKGGVVTNYAAIVTASYRDSVVAARSLSTAIDVLLAKPSEKSLAAARTAWLSARAPYSRTEAFRFYDGPIDQVETMINSWPIDENYIDYTVANPKAGIINDVSSFPMLSRTLILSLNEKEGKKNISAGFHALEFLLWGQDLDPNGPGNRSWRDYADQTKNADRRRQYLRLITDLLVENLETVASAWAEGNPGNYRSQFLSMNPDAALANILKGIGALSGPEIAGERLTTPYETKEQEEEQDCFSDNTRNDLIDDAIGIENVYFGHYTGATGQAIQGPGVHDLLLRMDAEFAGKMAAQVRTAVTCVRNIPQPFDQAVLGANTSPGRIAIKNAIVAFQTQSDMTAKAANLLSVKLNL